MIIPNVTDNNGTYSFTFDAASFSNIHILVIDNTGVTQKIIDVEKKSENDAQLKVRKIALDNPLDSKVNFQETRNAICMKSQDKHYIEDITSVDYQAIDSLQKAGQVIQELLRLKHQETQPLTTCTWLYNWNNADLEFKNKKYSMYMSNEMNFFLYFKDTEYFEEVVKPSIASKMEKTLIDYFLLEEYEQVEKYKQVAVFDSLNALEQCLLIAVVNMTDSETAKMLADQFINKAKLVETKTAKKDQKFDTVLLMKILESDEVEDDDEEDTTDGIKRSSKKKAVKRQRSMSRSSNSSDEEMAWAKKQNYESDSDLSEGEGDDYGEGEEIEKESDDIRNQNMESQNSYDMDSD